MEIEMKVSKFSFVIVGILMMFKPVYAANEWTEFHSKDYAITCSSFANNSVIGCSIQSDYVNHRYKAPKGCNLDFGQNFNVANKGRAEIECSSDAYGGENSQLLKVGQTIKGNGWSCTALKNDGIKCMNTSKKNGFILQKHRQVLINKR